VCVDDNSHSVCGMNIVNFHVIDRNFPHTDTEYIRETVCLFVVSKIKNLHTLDDYPYVYFTV